MSAAVLVPWKANPWSGEPSLLEVEHLATDSESEWVQLEPRALCDAYSFYVFVRNIPFLADIGKKFYESVQPLQ